MDRGLFHHILPENRSLYLKNILRVLKTKALVYLSVFSEKNPEGIGQRFTRNEIEEIFGNFKIASFREDSFPSQSPAHLLRFILQREK